MSNEVGNKLLEMTVNAILRGVRHLPNYDELLVEIEDIINKVKIYNLSDVVQKTRNTAYRDHVIKSGSGENGTSHKYYTPYTPFVDALFCYALLQAGSVTQHFSIIIDRFSEGRAVAYLTAISRRKGDYNLDYIAPVHVFINKDSVTVDLDTVNNFVDNNYNREITSKNADGEVIKSSVKEFLRDAVALMMFSVLDTFRVLQDQESLTYSCYIDEATQPKSHYIYRGGKRPAIKRQEKPIILVLRDDDKKESKVKLYKRKHGHIQYAFSWVVRGHYRKLHNPESVGKDRNGDKTVQGFTWVDTYYKGNLDAPLRKRETVIIDKRRKETPCTAQ